MTNKADFLRVQLKTANAINFMSVIDSHNIANSVAIML